MIATVLVNVAIILGVVVAIVWLSDHFGGPRT